MRITRVVVLVATAVLITAMHAAASISIVRLADL